MRYDSERAERELARQIDGLGRRLEGVGETRDEAARCARAWLRALIGRKREQLAALRCRRLDDAR